MRADNKGEYPDLNKLLDNHQDSDMPLPGPEPEDIATLLYTSGSTGHPKALHPPLEHYNCLVGLGVRRTGWHDG